jgi:hypothetical protein
MYGIYIKGERGRGFTKKVHIHSQSSSHILQNHLTLLFFTGRINNMHFASWHTSCYSSKSPQRNFFLRSPPNAYPNQAQIL